MPNFQPTLIILIFAAAQVGFLFLLRRQQDTLDYLFDELLDQGNYAQQQDRTYAKLWNALQAILKELSKTLQLHDRMAEHYDKMTTVADGALHTKLDEQRRYAEYLDTRLTAILDETCAIKQYLHDDMRQEAWRLAYRDQLQTATTPEPKNAIPTVKKQPVKTAVKTKRRRVAK
jgi:hypothetical protein